MSLVLNEEQLMLKSSAKEFCKSRTPVEALRRLRDERDENGFDKAVWNDMVEMGWTSLIIPENHGGLDFGYVGLGQVLEETGRTLTASPLVSSALLGTTTVLLAANESQKERLLPGLAAGQTTISLAIDEKNNHQPFQINTTAIKTNQGYHLNGKKVFVLDGHTANQLIVVARTELATLNKDGLSLFLVDPTSQGVQIEKSLLMDSRMAATVTLKNVVVSEDALIGVENEAGEIIEKILDIGRIGLSAEMVGSMQEAFERTVNYLKERHQFGVPIGSFQALQHRAAQMFGEIELCKSIVLKSLQAIDEGETNLALWASMTKAKVSETIQLVTNEAVQMFGGIGMTDDEEIGFFLKRARVAQQTLGDANFHMDRYAKLKGY